MKKTLFTLVFVLTLTLLSSCQYDKTKQFRLCFDSPYSYTGEICYQNTRHPVTLSVLEDKDLRLVFTEGKLKGLEKRMEEQGEAEVYDGMEFSLARPSDYYALYQAFRFLSQQQYLLDCAQAKASYIFSLDTCQICVDFDINTETPCQLRLTDEGQELIFIINEAKKE